MKAEKYTYILPEGYTIQPETRKQLDALVSRAGITNTLAQEFIDLHVTMMEEYAALIEACKPAVKVGVYQPEGVIAKSDTDISNSRRAKYGKKNNTAV